ncbi:MAG: peptidylprolyl isomerase [Bacteroidales bacterium]|jgi:cyclophilin family peptidyl-prolyl cis-trans isomerase|nr:peptidylprolyl isomerase [Bacteroidales bacterium]
MQSISRSISIFLYPLLLCQCASSGNSAGQVKVSISTSLGEIEIELYDQTPQHRDNFVKLVKEGFYDNTLFHRVIQGFMVQGGDPDSKNARPGVRLGTGGPDYTVPAEFVPELIHQRGALAAARQGDNVNPAKASSGSQFYIVQGKVYTDEELNQIEAQTAMAQAQQQFLQYIEEEEAAAKDAGQSVDASTIQEKARTRASEYLQNHPCKMNEEQRQIYKTAGGTPHLDGAYTVFGQVTRGLEVVDKIAAVETDDNNRPVTNVVINKIKIIR